MKYLTIPEDIVLGKDQEGKDVKGSFFQWLDGNPLNDEKFGKSAANLRMSVSIAKRVEGKAPGEVVPLEDKEWEILNEAIETPSSGYRTVFAKLFIPFMDAVKDASGDNPVRSGETRE